MTDTGYEIQGRAYRVADMPERLRPREEMERRGAEHVSDEVLLAILLRSGVKGRSVVELAREILREYRSLTALSRTSVDELAKITGMGRVKAQVLRAALELAKRLSEESAPASACVRAPEDAARLLRERARTLDNETFWVLLLDSKNHLKGEPVDITKGILNASLVHPREVFREAIRAASAAVVLAHNHPSGDPTPSSEDIRITRQIVGAGRIVDIGVLDHVILGQATKERAADFVSMRESGIVDFAG